VQTTYTGLRGYIEVQRDMYAEHNMYGDLKGFSFTHADILGWFLEKAEEFTGNNLELTKELKDSTPWFAPEIKQCYYNSMMYRSPFHADREVSYFEGWATSVIPIAHAWNVVDGKVADTTWELIREEDASEDTYLGIRIPGSFIMKVLSKSTHYRQANCAGPFLYDYIAVQLMNRPIYHAQLEIAQFEYEQNSLAMLHQPTGGWYNGEVDPRMLPAGPRAEWELNEECLVAARENLSNATKLAGEEYERYFQITTEDE